MSGSSVRRTVAARPLCCLWQRFGALTPDTDLAMPSAESMCLLWPRPLESSASWGWALISSFIEEALSAARSCAPSIARGLLFRAVPRNWRLRAEKLGCSTIHADHRRLHPALVAEICEAGYPLLTYTVNDAARAAMLFSWGVTSVFSDVPYIICAATASIRQPT